MKKGILIALFVVILVMVAGGISYLLLKDDEKAADVEVGEFSISVEVVTGPSQYGPPIKVRTNDTVRIFLEGVPDDMEVEWDIRASKIGYQNGFHDNPLEIRFDRSCRYVIQGRPSTVNNAGEIEYLRYELLVHNTDLDMEYEEEDGFTVPPLMIVLPHYDLEVPVKAGMSKPSINTSVTIENAVGIMDIEYLFRIPEKEDQVINVHQITGTGSDENVEFRSSGLNMDEFEKWYDYLFMIRVVPKTSSCSRLYMQTSVVY